MMDVTKAQGLLRAQGLDGWLFHDFHGRDPITHDLLGLGDGVRPSRRMFYFVPAQGEPVKVLSAIEPLLLDALPGRKVLYSGKAGQDEALGQLLRTGMRVACQYSPMGNVPTASTMDGGLLEYLRSLGPELVSSADLLQHFGAVLTPEQVDSHRRAGVVVHRIMDETFSWIRRSLDDGVSVNEWDMLEKMKALIAREGVISDGPPFFGVDDHASDPGYEPGPEGSYPIREGSRLILDFAARLPGEDTVYYDVTWCVQVGRTVDPEYQRLFRIVWEARQSVVDLLKARLAAGEPVCGYEADRQTRAVFEKYGLSRYILHRTGHSIGHACHSVGANLDDYETHDDRRLLPGTLFSVEPGLYTGKYGVRLEFDVYLSPEGEVQILGPVQKEILCI